MATDLYASVVLSLGPTGYWRLNETSGTTAYDSSGNGYNGTINNGVTLNQAGFLYDNTPVMGFSPPSSGQPGITIPSLPAFTGPWSITAWVNFTYPVATTGDYEEIFNNNQFFLRRSTGSEGGQFSIFVKLSDGSVEPRAQGGPVAIPNFWWFLAATWDTSTLSLYVQGNLVATSSRSGTLTSTTETPTIGCGEQQTITANPLTGKIAEVSVWSGKVLTATQIASLYGTGCSSPGTVRMIGPNTTILPPIYVQV